MIVFLSATVNVENPDAERAVREEYGPNSKIDAANTPYIYALIARFSFIYGFAEFIHKSHFLSRKRKIMMCCESGITAQQRILFFNVHGMNLLVYGCFGTPIIPVHSGSCYFFVFPFPLLVSTFFFPKKFESITKTRKRTNVWRILQHNADSFWML